MSHLCGKCKRVMCSDCLEIANEFEELRVNHMRALASANNHIKELETKLAQSERDKKRWMDTAKLGYPEVITRWMDSLSHVPIT